LANQQKQMAKKQTTSTDNIKLRHLTGAYLHMPDAPTEEDIIFFLSTKKFKTSTTPEITKAFGEHKADVIESVLRVLATKMVVSRTGLTENNIVTLIKD